ncbi:MAG TPA: alpha/beta hydrolase [Chthoniobacteraceae bacterium]|nr:alpha/beta hydrolase [Chthoniobacteraceae bacterium]
MNTKAFLSSIIAITLLPGATLFAQAPKTVTIPYVANGAARQNFDLHLPGPKGAQPYPLVVWIHGGAWKLGDKNWDNLGFLLKHGYAIASVDYRFTGEAPFPAQIQDCNTALNFILAHAADYGVDPKRFIVAGGSAGGHLALLLGMARTQKDFGADPAIKPLAIVDFFGPADFTQLLPDLKAENSAKGEQDYEGAVPALLGGEADKVPDKAKAASPVTYVAADNPPVLIVHGTKDPEVPFDQSRRLHEALDKAGVKNQLLPVENAGHDDGNFYKPDVQSKILAFLDSIFTQ